MVKYSLSLKTLEMVGAVILNNTDINSIITPNELNFLSSNYGIA